MRRTPAPPLLIVQGPIRSDYGSFMTGISLVISERNRWNRGRTIGKKKRREERETQAQTGMKYPPTPQSKTLLDMEVANYCEGLDPSYNTLGFEHAEVLYVGRGKCVQIQTDSHQNTNKSSTQKDIHWKIGHSLTYLSGPLEWSDWVISQSTGWGVVVVC